MLINFYKGSPFYDNILILILLHVPNLCVYVLGSQHQQTPTRKL